jgi:hypothetical protein
MQRELHIHGFVCELISMLVFFTQNGRIFDSLEFCYDAFCLLIQYLQSSVFYFVDSLKLFDDEFAIHDEMDFCASEFLYRRETENSTHIFCLIVCRRSEEKFTSFYHLASLTHDKSAPAWAGVSS